MGHPLARFVPALIGLVAGCGQDVALETFELSGRVSVLLESAEDGGPVEGATVTFVSDTLLTAQATTDGDGRYRMRVQTDVPLGQVRAEAPGFLAREATVFFDTPRRRIDLQLRREPDGG